MVSLPTICSPLLPLILSLLNRISLELADQRPKTRSTSARRTKAAGSKPRVVNSNLDMMAIATGGAGDDEVNSTTSNTAVQLHTDEAPPPPPEGYTGIYDGMVADEPRDFDGPEPLLLDPRWLIDNATVQQPMQGETLC
jgi:hypothetical protein